jgi:hypothetical protein
MDKEGAKRGAEEETRFNAKEEATERLDETRFKAKDEARFKVKKISNKES